MRKKAAATAEKRAREELADAKAEAEAARAALMAAENVNKVAQAEGHSARKKTTATTRGLATSVKRVSADVGAVSL